MEDIGIDSNETVANHAHERGKNNELNVFGVVHISSAVDICNESIKIPARIYKETEFRTKIQKKGSPHLINTFSLYARLSR